MFDCACGCIKPLCTYPCKGKWREVRLFGWWDVVFFFGSQSGYFSCVETRERASAHCTKRRPSCYSVGIISHLKLRMDRWFHFPPLFLILCLMRFDRANVGGSNKKVNFREKEKQILDKILGPTHYDRRIRPSGVVNGTGLDGTQQIWFLSFLSFDVYCDG